MRENCLVTKLVGTVQNPNLPVFNTAFFDWRGFDGVVGEQSVAFVVGVSDEATNPVVITSKSDMHLDAATGPATRTVSIAPGTKRVVMFKVADVGINPIKDFVTIENIYDLDKLGSYGRPELAFYITPTEHNGLESVLGYAPLDSFGGYLPIVDDTIALSKDYARLKAIALSVMNTVESYLYYITPETALTNCQWLAAETNVLGYQPVLKVSDIAAMTDIRYINNVRCEGNVVDLPTKLEYIGGLNTSLANGEIDDYIENCRNNPERNKNWLALAVSDFAASTVTFKGALLSTYVSTEPGAPTIPVINVEGRDYYIIEWDASTSGWATVAPADFRPQPSSIYWFEPYD